MNSFNLLKNRCSDVAVFCCKILSPHRFKLTNDNKILFGYLLKHIETTIL